ncbi:unnamed protein product [Albugo candida]|uniref:F-box/LRR-repeat protein 15-like leucin rich repeat domain-containing protein n=1 Tax=Albugo candida TaxID=65357 RepID=A0A024G046_9STRA|nr:unnamed protein product [Albugo candida]|eukprot:CCI40143.1 unnamed protein product [Albugo candida]
MDYLTVRERFRLLVCNKTLLRVEPIARDFTSQNEQDLSFWNSLFRYSRKQLHTLRVAVCESFDAELLGAEHSQHALQKLRVLELIRCKSVGAKELLALADTCQNLREICFRDMTIDSTALSLLLERNFKSLRVVHFWGCHTLNDIDIRKLTLCVKLTDLSLWGCHAAGSLSIIPVVERCRKLRRLNLRYCHKVDDRVVAMIADHLPCLRDLNLRYCYRITDRAVEKLCESLVHLENLNLSQCTRITDYAIFRIVASLTNLKELRLWGCVKLTAASVIAISAGLPSLRLMDIRSRDKFEAVIGGQVAYKYVIQTYRNKLAKWEQTSEIGIYRRPLACFVLA